MIPRYLLYDPPTFDAAYRQDAALDRAVEAFLRHQRKQLRKKQQRQARREWRLVILVVVFAVAFILFCDWLSRVI